MYPWMASIVVQVNASAVLLELQRNDMDRVYMEDLISYITVFIFLCAILFTANLWLFFVFFY